MANVLKKAVLSLMERTFARGFVLAVRKWNPHGMVEVDLHLPDVDMSKWQTIQRLKCKVSAFNFEFRDYTPARWDVDKRTCTLYIETGHTGFGADWADNLLAGDIVLFGPAHAAALPHKPGRILCIGDGSALGHFLALKQLTDRKEYSMEALILLNEHYTLPDDLLTAYPEFEWLMAPSDNLDTLHRQVQEKTKQDYTSIFIAGNIGMASSLRKMLKKNPYLTARVVVHGFWK